MLMAECVDKNMIDKDEYPQTAELERRCVAILADLWNAPVAESATGCSTTGSSEACMLAGMALKRRWAARTGRARPQAQPGDGRERPGLLGEVLPVLGRRAADRPDGGRAVPPRRRRAPSAAVDENTIGVVAILGSTFDGSYEPVGRDRGSAGLARRGRRSRRADARRRRVGRDDRAVPRPGSGLGLPAAPRRIDQHVRAQVRPGLPGRRLGALARCRRAAARS